MSLGNLIINHENYGLVPFISSFHKIKPEFGYAKNFWTLLVGICSISPVIIQVIIIALEAMAAILLVFTVMLILSNLTYRKYNDKDLSRIDDVYKGYFYIQKPQNKDGKHTYNIEIAQRNYHRDDIGFEIDLRWKSYILEDFFFFTVLCKKTVHKNLLRMFLAMELSPGGNLVFKGALDDEFETAIDQGILKKRYFYMIIVVCASFTHGFGALLVAWIEFKAEEIRSIVNPYDFAQYFSGGVFNYQSTFVGGIRVNLSECILEILNIIRMIVDALMILEVIVLASILIKQLPDICALLLLIDATYCIFLKLYAAYYEIKNLLKHQYEIGYDYSRGITDAGGIFKIFRFLLVITDIIDIQKDMVQLNQVIKVWIFR